MLVVIQPCVGGVSCTADTAVLVVGSAVRLIQPCLVGSAVRLIQPCLVGSAVPLIQPCLVGSAVRLIQPCLVGSAVPLIQPCFLTHSSQLQGFPCLHTADTYASLSYSVHFFAIISNVFLCILSLSAFDLFHLRACM